ncbi:NUMOD4 motif/HNH endonuclease [Clostridium paraputrificum]|uniref:NUMOD4 domain-containing protein n=1 Tax=Clostridium paraputrificum TaxID=29363 RepID=UPI000D9063C5|nr:NUMOD4 domain-containing protein [Clostridium paraputrificum]SQB99773.1 NUMOD4 motif/HNH endonuclease [Clostridium paraputrificum]
MSSKVNYENEIWRDIEGYEDLYRVSNCGRIMSLPKIKGVGYYTKEIILKPKINKVTGYLQVNLYKNKKRKTHNIHKLVAMTFIPNPQNKPFIDHSNTIKTDNRVENLRWVTRKENQNNELTRKHLSECNKGKKLSEETKNKISNALIGNDYSSKKIICTTTFMVFNSVKEGANYYGIRYPEIISRCCLRRKYSKSAGKLQDGTPLRWMYYDEWLQTKNVA